jgi:hypothetical protein
MVWLRAPVEPATAATNPNAKRSQDGDSIQIQIQYVRGAMTTGKAEQMMYSAAKPDFYRIYRSEQSTDVVRGAETDRIQKFMFKASDQCVKPSRPAGTASQLLWVCGRDRAALPVTTIRSPDSKRSAPRDISRRPFPHNPATES